MFGETINRIETAANISFDATAAVVQTALSSLPSIGFGNVSVTDPGTGVLEIEFLNALRSTALQSDR